MLREGDPAPDFTLESDSGESVTLSSLRGRPVVLYFYPKDDTPGCTAQASHERFKSKYSLPFTLLADPERLLAEPYGVGREGKSSYERSTFVIDADGNVARIMRRVNPDRHADEVLTALAPVP
jgi:thioredoxin-dependent peroxiredoxin